MGVMMSDKKLIRNRTFNGDWYRATEELWASYEDAVKRGDWEYVEFLESGENPDFRYDP